MWSVAAVRQERGEWEEVRAGVGSYSAEHAGPMGLGKEELFSK